LAPINVVGAAVRGFSSPMTDAPVAHLSSAELFCPSSAISHTIRRARPCGEPLNDLTWNRPGRIISLAEGALAAAPGIVPENRAWPVGGGWSKAPWVPA